MKARRCEKVIRRKEKCVKKGYSSHAMMCNHDAVAQREPVGTGLYSTHPPGAIPALPLSLCT